MSFKFAFLYKKADIIIKIFEYQANGYRNYFCV